MHRHSLWTPPCHMQPPGWCTILSSRFLRLVWCSLTFLSWSATWRENQLNFFAPDKWLTLYRTPPKGFLLSNKFSLDVCDKLFLFFGKTFKSPVSKCLFPLLWDLNRDKKAQNERKRGWKWGIQSLKDNICSCVCGAVWDRDDAVCAWWERGTQRDSTLRSVSKTGAAVV